jgi:dipeptidyl aminopeptidase/acylaminoacyl peptidase
MTARFRTLYAAIGALVALVTPGFLAAQQDSGGYRIPSPDLVAIVDAQPTATVSIDPHGTWMLLMARRSLPSIAELAAPELRLAGLRIDPRTNGPSRFQAVVSLTLRPLADGDDRMITGMPEGARIGNVSWSPDGNRIAFSVTNDHGIELWAATIADAKARRVGTRHLNGAIATPYRWLPDSRGMLVVAVHSDRGAAPEKPIVPNGPVVQSHEGKSAPARTYQDLLGNSYDEDLFDYHATAELLTVSLEGAERAIAPSLVLTSVEPSPDGRFVLVESIHRPYSYRHPYDRFPRRAEIYTIDGRRVHTVADEPLADAIPITFGSVETGPRSIAWRDDAPATVYWSEARDGGDAGKPADVRDEVLMLAAPFTGAPTSIANLPNRYGGVTWGNDTLALLDDWWYKTRRTRTILFNPSRPTEQRVIIDRSFEDRYADPGDPLLHPNRFGRNVLLLSEDARALFLTGLGASPEGNRPFLDRFELASSATQRLWQSKAPYYERLIDLISVAPLRIVTTRESPTERPNYLLRDLTKGTERQLTTFPHPYPQLAGVQKELIHYDRADGVKLTATLYLPAGYTKQKGPLPAILWAYPQEFKSAEAAGQVTESPYSFNWISWSNALAFVARGYAVIDDPSMPIIGEGETEPNDSYVAQLVASAQAAVDAAVARGVVDRNRVAVGGHSYGAFMTANLLAHSDIFRAGLARSGAYNRTLTPFGFQGEERSYWQAPLVYDAMSPFMNADRIDEPLLLTHGGADNNPGTHTMQSERLFEAIKGLGGTTRLVVLPHEGHGYRARESVLHMLYETEQWLERWVRNAPPRLAAPGGAVDASH